MSQTVFRADLHFQYVQRVEKGSRRTGQNCTENWHCHADDQPVERNYFLLWNNTSFHCEYVVLSLSNKSWLANSQAKSVGRVSNGGHREKEGQNQKVKRRPEEAR